MLLPDTSGLETRGCIVLTEWPSDRARRARNLLKENPRDIFINFWNDHFWWFFFFESREPAAGGRRKAEGGERETKQLFGR